MKSISAVFILVRVFLLELVREKWLVGLVLVALAMFLFSQTLGSLSFDEQERILFHLSISTIHILGVAICLIHGVGVMNKEVERQTCLLMLVRPLTRVQFLLAKILALSIFLALFDFILGSILGLLLGLQFLGPSLYSILFVTWIEHVILLCFAVWSGLFLGRAVAGLFTVGIFLIGHWLPDLLFFAEKSKNDMFILLSKGVRLAAPHLFEFDLRTIDILKSGIAAQQLIWCGLHALGWICLLFFAASWIWRRKDLV